METNYKTKIVREHVYSRRHFLKKENIKLVHNASRAYQIILNHFQSLLPSCTDKRFTTIGEQTLLDVPENLSITKAIYQLNKYIQARPNTNLDKTQNLFTVEFHESLEIF